MKKRVAVVTGTRPECIKLAPVYFELQRSSVIEPVYLATAQHRHHLQFVWMMNRCTFLLSDSGGVQEEAPSLGKPVLVMRETTERPEGVAAGTCRVVGTDPDKILTEAVLLLDDQAEYQRRSQLANPYGDGWAAERMRHCLEASLTHLS